MCFGCVCCPPCTHFLRLCVCLFPTCAGRCYVSHAGLLFPRDIADIFQSNRDARYNARSQRWRCGARSKDLPFTTWEGTVFMHKFVIENVSPRKTSKTYGQCCKCRTHKHCQQRHAISLQFRRGRGSHLVHTFCPCVCLFPTADGCCPLSQLGFLFHRNIADIVQCNRGVLRNLGGYRLHAEGRDQERVVEKNQKTY